MRICSGIMTLALCLLGASLIFAEKDQSTIISGTDEDTVYMSKISLRELKTFIEIQKIKKAEIKSILSTIKDLIKNLKIVAEGDGENQEQAAYLLGELKPKKEIAIKIISSLDIIIQDSQDIYSTAKKRNKSKVWSEHYFDRKQDNTFATIYSLYNEVMQIKEASKESLKNVIAKVKGVAKKIASLKEKIKAKQKRINSLQAAANRYNRLIHNNFATINGVPRWDTNRINSLHNQRFGYIRQRDRHNALIRQAHQQLKKLKKELAALKKK